MFTLGRRCPVALLFKDNRFQWSFSSTYTVSPPATLTQACFPWGTASHFLLLKTLAKANLIQETCQTLVRYGMNVCLQNLNQATAFPNSPISSILI